MLTRLSEPHRDRISREGRLPLSSILSSLGSTSKLVRALTRFLRGRGLKWEDLRTFVKVQKELFEIDARFGQLGDRSIFRLLDRAGVLSHRVPGVNNIEHAMESPPAAGRARLRGEAIRQITDNPDNYLSSWEKICDMKTRQMLDLSDPFPTTPPEWKEWTRDDEYLVGMHRRVRSRMFLDL